MALMIGQKQGALMGANSRNKGSGFEREVAGQLLGLTGITFKRDLEQVRAADHGDLIPSDDAWPFVVECKRYATGSGCKPAWQAQAAKAAAAVGKFPAVIFRYDRRDVEVSIPMGAITLGLGGMVVNGDSNEWVTVTLQGFAYLAAEIMAGAAA